MLLQLASELILWSHFCNTDIRDPINVHLEQKTLSFVYYNFYLLGDDFHKGKTRLSGMVRYTMEWWPANRRTQMHPLVLIFFNESNMHFLGNPGNNCGTHRKPMQE